MTLQLRSRVDADGTVEISFVDVPMPTPKPNEVLVRIDAAPLNPSDLNLMLGRADLSTFRATGTKELPAVTARVTEGVLPELSARFGQSLTVGNEGAGVVIAGAPAAQALIGKIVGFSGGATYSEHRCLPASQCLTLAEGTTAIEAASNFVNPMTALSMLETMRREGHTAIVHTAAASNLGRMLAKVCAADGVALVNVVRKPDQVATLRAMGDAHVCDSSAPTFDEDLRAAIGKTGATLAFDAIAGGDMASRILAAMEAVAVAKAAHYSSYGSTTHKQVYLYGVLDRGPTVLARNYGMAWGVGGWLVTSSLGKGTSADFARLRARVGQELRTTFASQYTGELSLAELLEPASLARYAKQATGEKYVFVPSRGR